MSIVLQRFFSRVLDLFRLCSTVFDAVVLGGFGLGFARFVFAKLVEVDDIIGHGYVGSEVNRNSVASA